MNVVKKHAALNGKEITICVFGAIFELAAALLLFSGLENFQQHVLWVVLPAVFGMGLILYAARMRRIRQEYSLQVHLFASMARTDADNVNNIAA